MTGRKVWTAGEILAAADVNSYLMDQSVMVFADATARTSAIASPTEGMVTYLSDTNALQYYDGAAYQTVGLDPITFTASTATAYTAVSGDAGSYIQFTNAATVTFSTATAFTPGQQLQILCDGTATTIAGGTGVVMAGAGSIGTANSFTVGDQYEAVSVFCVATDSYRVIGNVTAV